MPPCFAQGAGGQKRKKKLSGLVSYLYTRAVITVASSGGVAARPIAELAEPPPVVSHHAFNNYTELAHALWQPPASIQEAATHTFHCRQQHKVLASYWQLAEHAPLWGLSGDWVQPVTI